MRTAPIRCADLSPDRELSQEPEQDRVLAIAACRAVLLPPAGMPPPVSRTLRPATVVRSDTLTRCQGPQPSPAPSQVLFKYCYVLFSRHRKGRYWRQRTEWRTRYETRWRSRRRVESVRNGGKNEDPRAPSTATAATASKSAIEPASKPAAPISPRSLRSLRPMTKPKPCQRFCTRFQSRLRASVCSVALVYHNCGL